MQAIRIQQMPMPSLSLAHRQALLGLSVSSIATRSMVGAKMTPGGNRSFWSGFRRGIGKSLQQMAESWKVRNDAEPKADDGAVHPTVEPLRPIVYPEQPEMEESKYLYVSHSVLWMG